MPVLISTTRYGAVVIGETGWKESFWAKGRSGRGASAPQRYAKLLTRAELSSPCARRMTRTSPRRRFANIGMVFDGGHAAFVVNWKDKADNLVAIPSSSTLGSTVSFLSTTDPVERARVRQSLPMVARTGVDGRRGPTCAVLQTRVFRGGRFNQRRSTSRPTLWENASGTRCAARIGASMKFLRGLQMSVVSDRCYLLIWRAQRS